MATYDGGNIFGRSVSVTVVTHPSDAQMTSFFGANGVYRLHGGSRGRTITVSGVLYGADLSAVLAARATIESYNDGIARVLVDTAGYSWGYVVFTGHFEPIGKYSEGHGGVIQPYRATFTGLI